MREIKFRAWHPNRDGMVYFDWKNPDQAISMGKLLSFRELQIMQFTGLLDKNGKEIYEGDMLAYSQSGEVEMRLSGDVRYLTEFGKFVIWMDERSPDRNHCIDLPNCHVYEVIGNIYDNPELLEKK